MKSDNFDWNKIPDFKGVYTVIRRQVGIPTFLPSDKGTGGWFKGKNPNVSVQTLENKWVEFNDGQKQELYIGQAGGGKSKETLRRRIRAYIRFGQKLPIAHWGGRYIWQLKDADSLEINWEEVREPLEDSLEVEKRKLIEFKNNHYQKLPFANIRM